MENGKMICEACGTGAHFIKSMCKTNCLKLKDNGDIEADLGNAMSPECNCDGKPTSGCC